MDGIEGVLLYLNRGEGFGVINHHRHVASVHYDCYKQRI